MTTENLESILESVLLEYGFECGIIASSSGQELARRGELGGLQWRGLVDSLFGDADSIVRLERSLEGQILPQTYSQGNVRCVVMKPRKDLLVGLFTQNAEDAALLYQRGKEVSARLDREMSGD
jgi:hypothetical protein